MSKFKFYDPDSTNSNDLSADIQNTIAKFDQISKASNIVVNLHNEKVINEHQAFIIFKKIIRNPAEHASKKNFDEFVQKLDNKYILEDWSSKEQRLERDIIKYQLASFVASHCKTKEMNDMRDSIYINLATQIGSKEQIEHAETIKAANPEIDKLVSIGKRTWEDFFSDIVYNIKSALRYITNALNKPSEKQSPSPEANIHKNIRLVSDAMLESKVSPPPIPALSAEFQMPNDPPPPIPDSSAELPMPSYPPPPIPGALRPGSTPLVTATKSKQMQL